MHVWEKRAREGKRRKRREEDRAGSRSRLVRLRIVFPPTIDLFVNRAAPGALFPSLSLLSSLFCALPSLSLSLSLGHSSFSLLPRPSQGSPIGARPEIAWSVEKRPLSSGRRSDSHVLRSYVPRIWIAREATFSRGIIENRCRLVTGRGAVRRGSFHGAVFTAGDGAIRAVFHPLPSPIGHFRRARPFSRCASMRPKEIADCPLRGGVPLEFTAGVCRALKGAAKRLRVGGFPRQRNPRVVEKSAES